MVKHWLSNMFDPAGSRVYARLRGPYWELPARHHVVAPKLKVGFFVQNVGHRVKLAMLASTTCNPCQREEFPMLALPAF